MRLLFAPCLMDGSLLRVCFLVSIFLIAAWSMSILIINNSGCTSWMDKYRLILRKRDRIFFYKLFSYILNILQDLSFVWRREMKMRLNKTALISLAVALLVVVVPFAFAQCSSPPPTCNCPGKVTGGGQIEFLCPCTGLHRATFGFNIVLYPGETVPKGELEYVDHSWNLAGYKPPMLVHAHNMKTLCVNPEKTSATFTGDCTINHQSGYTFEVYVEDNGEPGKSDVFMIWLFDQSHNTVYQGAGDPIHNGNIQIHVKP
jgi:hypothetical protein